MSCLLLTRATGSRHAVEWAPPTWEEVVRDHGARVYRLAYRLTGNSHDAEDLTQDVFIRVFNSLHRFQPGHLRGLAAPDHHQPVPRLRPPQAEDPLRRSRRRLRRAAASRWPTPSEQLTDAGLDHDVAAALAALPPEFRAAVVLCDIEGLTYEEIAAVLDIKIGTVRSRIHRGRAQLARRPGPPPTDRRARALLRRRGRAGERTASVGASAARTGGLEPARAG